MYFIGIAMKSRSRKLVPSMRPMARSRPTDEEKMEPELPSLTRAMYHALLQCASQAPELARFA